MTDPMRVRWSGLSIKRLLSSLTFGYYWIVYPRFRHKLAADNAAATFRRQTIALAQLVVLTSQRYDDQLVRRHEPWVHDVVALNIYSIEDNQLIVCVVKVGHRSEA